MTVPVSATPTRVAPFDPICTSAVHNIGALTGSPQILWSVAGATSNAFGRVLVKAAASAATATHTDYSDALTFIAAGVF